MIDSASKSVAYGALQAYAPDASNEPERSNAMQTLKQVLSRQELRECLQSMGVCAITVCGFVILAFLFVILASVL